MKETSLYSLFHINQSERQTEDASLNWLKYKNGGSCCMFRLLQLLMECVQDEDQLLDNPIFLEDIERVYINETADLPLFSTFHTNKHLCLMGDFFTFIIRHTIYESIPFEDYWLASIVVVFIKMINNTSQCSKSIKFFAGYCAAYLLTALENSYTTIETSICAEGLSAFFALYTRLASALFQVFEMCLQTESYLPYLVYLFRESLQPLRYLLTSKVFNDIQKKIVVRICRAVVSEMTAHIADCVTGDLRPVVLEALKLLELKPLTAFETNFIDDYINSHKIYRYMFNSDRDIRRLTAKLFVSEHPKNTVLKAIKYHRQYQNEKSMQLLIDAFGDHKCFVDFKKMFQFVQKNGHRRSVACHAIAAILNSVKYQQNKSGNYSENTKTWELFFKNLATAFSVNINCYDPLVYLNLIQFYFDVFDLETLRKNNKIAKYISYSMHKLSINFALTTNYILAVRIAKVIHMRDDDPLHTNLTNMAMHAQERFNTDCHTISSVELCLDSTMKIYILIDLTDEFVEFFDILILVQTLDSCLAARGDLLANSKVQAFCVMICVKVLALLYDYSEQAQNHKVSDIVSIICNDQFQLLLQSLHLALACGDDREPFLEYMIFNAVCFSLIKFMPRLHTSANPQSVTFHLDRVISEQLNDFLTTFIHKVSSSTCESMYQASGMIRSLTKLYKIVGSCSNLSLPHQIFSIYSKQSCFDADIVEFIKTIFAIDVGFAINTISFAAGYLSIEVTMALTTRIMSIQNGPQAVALQQQFEESLKDLQ